VSHQQGNRYDSYLTERLIRKIFDNPEFVRRSVIAAEVEKRMLALSPIQLRPQCLRATTPPIHHPPHRPDHWISIETAKLVSGLPTDFEPIAQSQAPKKSSKILSAKRETIYMYRSLYTNVRTRGPISSVPAR